MPRPISVLLRYASVSLQALLVAVSVAACAAVAHVPAQIDLLDSAARGEPLVLAEPVSIAFDTGYRRDLRAGSRWLRVGSVAQGAVYKPHDDIFTVEGAHMHEAYLVVGQGKVVGFYLPAERAFTPLSQPLAIFFK